MAEELKKSLGFWRVSALIITSMIGTSLFFGVSFAARLAGPASIISWILLGLVTLYVGACFAELITMYPSSGGVYEFTKQSFGRFPSFLVGWITWLVSNIGSAVLVVAAIDFLLPGGGTLSIAGYTISKALLKFGCAIIVIVLFNYVTYRGIDASGALLVFFALVVIGLIIALLIPGFSLFNAEHFMPLDVAPLLILAASFFLVESFFGWEAASFLAEETKEPEKTVPRALFAATLITVLLAVALATMMIGALGADALATDANPIATITGLVAPFALPIVAIGVFFTFLGGVIGNVVSSPRLLFALARDKLFIEQCTKIHPRYQTPVNAIIFQTIVTIAVVVIAFGNYQFLLSMLVPLALVMYSVVLLSVPLLRRTKPNHPRPYTVPFGSWLPGVIAAFYAAIVIGWFTTTAGASSVAVMIVSFLFIAFPIYLFLTMVYNPDAIISVNNSAARLNYFLEDVLLPRQMRHEILDLFRGHLKGKEVLEFGAGVGTFTMLLAEEVGPQGSVTAVDLSKSNLEILAGRARKRGHTHVHVLHDEHQINRVHPDIKHADVIYSVGFLGYVQDLKKVLREMRSILAPHGKICFVEYTNFFKVLPDPAIVSDLPRLEAAFRESGFAVSVRKRKGFLWNYVIINGIKTDSNVPYI